MDHEDFAVIRKLPLFAGLPVATLSELLQGAVPRAYPKGRLLFQQGEPADSFFIVLSGWVKIFRLAPNGEEAVLGVFTRGESFAEAAMFIGGQFPASAEVVEGARLLRVMNHTFGPRLHAVPEVALNMLASTSRHLHLLIEQVEQLQVRSGTQRVADFLLKLCPVAEGSAVIALPYDKSLIASRLGMKPESFSRALARLRKLGVKTQQSSVTISDIEALIDYSERESARALNGSQSAGRQ